MGVFHLGKLKERIWLKSSFPPSWASTSYFLSSLSLFPLLSSVRSGPCFKPGLGRQDCIFVSAARVLRKAERCPEQLNAGTNHLRGNDKSVRCALSFTMRWRGRVSTTTAAVFSVSAAFPSRSPFVCSCLFFSSGGTKENNICSSPFKITFSLFAEMDSCCHLQYLTRASRKSGFP